MPIFYNEMRYINLRFTYLLTYSYRNGTCRNSRTEIARHQNGCIRMYRSGR